MEKTEKNLTEDKKNMVFKRMTLFFNGGRMEKFTYRGDQTLEIYNQLKEPSKIELKTELEALAFKCFKRQIAVYGVVVYNEQMEIDYCEISNDVLIDKIGFNDLVKSFQSSIDGGGGSTDSTSTSTITDNNS